MRCFFAATAALFMLTVEAYAATDAALASIDSKLSACLDKNQTNLGMRQCTNDAAKAADKLLNARYDAIVRALREERAGGDSADDPEILKRLIASERAWVAWRDAEANLQGIAALGGSGEPLDVLTSWYRLTKLRVQDLDRLFGGRMKEDQ